MVVGSPDYLRSRKRPERIDDLRQHACLRMRRSNGSIAPWSSIDGNKAVEAIVSGPLITNDLPTLLGAEPKLCLYRAHEGLLGSYRQNQHSQ
jgi:hypothetical protein